MKRWAVRIGRGRGAFAVVAAIGVLAGSAVAAVSAPVQKVAKETRAPSAPTSYTEPFAGLNMEMVWIPGGTFQMGSRLSAEEVATRYGGKEEFFTNEHPLHTVELDGFWMGKFEVTNAQFRKFRPSHSSKAFEGHSLNGDDQPVVHVWWDDAKAFCKWLSEKTGKQYCLPTEAQWEYACRAGTNTVWYWGDDEASMGRYANVAGQTAKTKFPKWGQAFKALNVDFAATDDGYAVTAPVGEFQPNAFGLYDMIGNVCEVCADLYDTDYYRTSPPRNPTGSANLKFGNPVCRGGGWGYVSGVPVTCRSASRSEDSPEFRYLFGFRLARTGVLRHSH